MSEHTWDGFDFRAVTKAAQLYKQLQLVGKPPTHKEFEEFWGDLPPEQRTIHHTCAFAWGWEDDWGILIEESRELLGLSRLEMIAFFIFVEVNKLRHFTDTLSVRPADKEPWE